LFTSRLIRAYYKRGDDMLGFIAGTFFGGAVGVLTMCLCTAAKWGDDINDNIK
jgi:glutamine amidotransferase-like uncharacterized protein